MWRGQRLNVEVTEKELRIVNETGLAPVELEIRSETRSFTDRITVQLN